MANYRLIFPPVEGTQETESAHIDSGDKIYSVGDEIEYRGKRWLVSQAPLEDPLFGQTADLMVWPAD